jgi:hypothetical protein
VIKDQWAADKILKELGYDRGYMNVFKGGFTLSCDKNGQHLYIVVTSEGIYIEGQGKASNDTKNNAIVAKIYPTGGNQETKPSALTIDIKSTKTYTDESDEIDHRRTVISGDGSWAFSNQGSGYFEFQQAENGPLSKIDDAKSFLEFLQNCQCTELIKEILATENPFYDISADQRSFFKDIDSIETIREILELIPKKNLALWRRFLNLAVRYQKKDRTQEDEYRHPQDTLQSGWADCDDYAVINAFWSYLHGYEPSYIEINLPPDAEGNKRAHGFVWFSNEEARIVVLDNDNCTILEKGKTVTDYLKETWPGAQKRLDEEA